MPKRRPRKREDHTPPPPSHAIRWSKARNLFLLAVDGRWVWYCRRSGLELLTWNPNAGFFWVNGKLAGNSRDWTVPANAAVAQRDRSERRQYLHHAENQT